MSIILDTQPYMLYETVGMLVKYVNGVSMLEVRDTMLRLYRKGLDDTWRRRLECLQKIIQTVCRDVDLEDPEIQYFFSKREPGSSQDATTLAWTMTFPFCEHQSHNLEEEASILKTAGSKFENGASAWNAADTLVHRSSPSPWRAARIFDSQRIPPRFCARLCRGSFKYPGGLRWVHGSVGATHYPLRPASGGKTEGAFLAYGNSGGLLDPAVPDYDAGVFLG